MKSKGFTIVELMVSAFIITTLSAVILLNYRAGDQKLAVERTAYKISQDIRLVQKMAIAGQEVKASACSPSPCVPAGGYGIHFDLGFNKSYFLFADISKDGIYDEGEMIGNVINLEKKVKITSITGGVLNIIFFPPEPTVSFKDGGGNILSGDSVAIIISLDDGSSTRSIIVNKLGLVSY